MVEFYRIREPSQEASATVVLEERGLLLSLSK